MATRRNASILGDFNGRIGTVVLSKWKGTSTMRGVPIKRKNKKSSKKQTHQNTIFSKVEYFLRSAATVISIGFQQQKKAKITALNAATSFHMLNAVIDDPADPYIDLAKVKFSCPIWSTQPAWNPVLLAEEGRKIIVTWELNPFPQKCTQLSDKVFLLFYDKQKDRFLTSEGRVNRAAMSCSCTLMKNTGIELYCYMFMVSADGKLVSETEYLGMVKLME
jgi:hypothetical protein